MNESRIVAICNALVDNMKKEKQVVDDQHRDFMFSMVELFPGQHEDMREHLKLAAHHLLNAEKQLGLVVLHAEGEPVGH